MTIKGIRQENYKKYFISIAQHPDKVEFAVYYSGKNSKPKIKSFLYSTLEEGEKSIQSDIQALEKAKKDSRGTDNFPSKEEFVECLKYLLDEITDNQLKMLISHAKAEGKKMSAMELAKSCGYEDFETANKQYGDLGHKICDFVSYAPTEKNQSTNQPVWTFVIASGDYDENKHWYWIMHESLFEALKESNLLN